MSLLNRYQLAVINSVKSQVSSFLFMIENKLFSATQPQAAAAPVMMATA